MNEIPDIVANQAGVVGVLVWLIFENRKLNQQILKGQERIGTELHEHVMYLKLRERIQKEVTPPKTSYGNFQTTRHHP